jgi:signal transduction histidine kinase
MAREIITKQGGYIKVISEVGQGTTLSVFLPKK